MSTDLLRREQELTKINEQLEKRSKQLLLEAESVMSLNKYGFIDSLEDIPEKKNKKENIQKEEVIENDLSEDITDEFPENCQNMGKKAYNQYLRSKVKVLQNDVDMLKSKYKTKLTEIKQLEQDYEKIQEERNKWKRFAETYKEQKDKLSQQILTLQNNIQTKDSHVFNLKKENDILTKELKSINTSNASQDLKLNKVTEELEKVKANLQNAKKIEKDLRESHRREILELSSTNKKLMKQNNDLTSGFKKQLLLIDNLKKQKMHLEALKIADFVEDEFMKILDWKPDTIPTKK